jgi:hypothetical protein
MDTNNLNDKIVQLQLISYQMKTLSSFYLDNRSKTSQIDIDNFLVSIYNYSLDIEKTLNTIQE